MSALGGIRGVPVVVSGHSMVLIDRHVRISLKALSVLRAQSRAAP